MFTLRNSSAGFRAALKIRFSSRPFDLWLMLSPALSCPFKVNLPGSNSEMNLVKMLSVQKPYFHEARCVPWDCYPKVGVNFEGMCNCVEFHPTPSLVGLICLGQMAMSVHFLPFHPGPVGESSVESRPQFLERTMSSQKIEIKLTPKPLHDARCPADSRDPCSISDFLHNCDFYCTDMSLCSLSLRGHLSRAILSAGGHQHGCKDTPPVSQWYLTLCFRGQKCQNLCWFASTAVSQFIYCLTVLEDLLSHSYGRIYCLTVLEYGSQNPRCHQGCAPFETCREEYFLAFPRLLMVCWLIFGVPWFTDISLQSSICTWSSLCVLLAKCCPWTCI